MRPAKNILHHLFVRRAIVAELRSGNVEDIRSQFEAFQDTGPSADKNKSMGGRGSRW